MTSEMLMPECEHTPQCTFETGPCATASANVGTPIGKGHVTGKCPCGVYHGRRRYPQPQYTAPVPLTLFEMINDDAWLNDMRVVARALNPADRSPKGDDLTE